MREPKNVENNLIWLSQAETYCMKSKLLIIIIWDLCESSVNTLSRESLAAGGLQGTVICQCSLDLNAHPRGYPRSLNNITVLQNNVDIYFIDTLELN